MGFGDPDHQHPLKLLSLEKDTDCFRCELPIIHLTHCYGCTRCSHFVHCLCLGLPENMTYPLHPQHSLTLLPSSTTSSSQVITDNCNQCLQPFVGGYAYRCQACFKFNLHLKCFLTVNLETKHHHPLSLSEFCVRTSCCICGLVIDPPDSYYFECAHDGCSISAHFECISLPPIVKHRHVHELTFEYNYPEGCKVVDCDVCLNKDDEKELYRGLSYYYCKGCDYIAHVRCVTTQPPKVTTQFDHFIHEHPMLFLRFPRATLRCAACKRFDLFESFYFCSMCNYALHKSCAQFPRFIKHPHHEENHTLSLQSCASLNKDYELVSCEFCNIKLKGMGWIFQCSDCNFAVHLPCARDFKHPFYNDIILFFSSHDKTKFRCDACGGLGDGFRMSTRQKMLYPLEHVDLHIECCDLPGQIEHGCHPHTLYLVNSPTEIKSYLSSVFECDICHTEADPDLWVYCCIQCKYIAHLKCVVSDLLPSPGMSCVNFSNFRSLAMFEKERFRSPTNLDDCSKLRKKPPLFLPRGFFFNLKPLTGDHIGRSITLDATDPDKPFTDTLCCPKCEQPISSQAYSRIWDWVHHNFGASIYNNQIQTRADHESLALLDEKVVDELYCPVCNLLIFPPTYSCADCQIFFHKSCAEIPRQYTVDGGHTLVLQSPSMNSSSLSNCSLCERPCKGYAYFCASCEIGFDVTCALGAPLLKLENQKHSLFATTSAWSKGDLPKCEACRHDVTEGHIYFKCGASHCIFSDLHIECAQLPRVVKHRIHQHPLVLESNLDLSVDDYVCDVCEKELNPCIWVYRCSDSCGDRATSHVSCIVTSNKKKCHFVYDEECSYPHLKGPMAFHRKDSLPSKKNTVSDLAAAIMNKTPGHKYVLVKERLLWSFVDELEHEYADPVTEELMKVGQAGVFHLMESPDALRAKVSELMKELRSVLAYADEQEND